MLRTTNKKTEEDPIFDRNLVESINLAIHPTLFTQSPQGKLIDLRISRVKTIMDRILDALIDVSPARMIKGFIQLGTVLQHNYLTIQHYLDELDFYQHIELPPLNGIEVISRAQIRLCEKIVKENIPKNTFAILALAKGISLFVTLLGNHRVNQILNNRKITETSIARAERFIEEALPVVDRDVFFLDRLLSQETAITNSNCKMLLFFKAGAATLEVFCKKQIEDIRQKNEEKKMSRLKFFSNTDDTKTNIDDIIAFLKENKEFFAAPFLNQKKFSHWASGRRFRKTLTAWEAGYGGKIQQLSSELKKALGVDEVQLNPQLIQFHQAILGEGGKKNGLMQGKVDRMRHLLINNAALCSVLIKYFKDPLIPFWYQDNKVPRASSFSMSLLRR